MQLAAPAGLQAIASAQTAMNNDNQTDVARANRLAAHLVAVQALTDISALDLQGLGTAVVDAAVQEWLSFCSPQKFSNVSSDT